MAIEFELKYSATPEIHEQLLPLAENWVTIAMETTYYDTPSCALSNRKYTLRRRLENGVSICTVKTPAANGARGEWETPCEDIQAAIPVLCKLGAPADLSLLAAEGLTNLCGARFTRRAATVQQEDSLLELALDQGVLFSGALQQPLCEVEVELKTGEPTHALVYANMLAQKFSLSPQPHSKFRRALSLYKEANHGTVK